MQNLSCMAPGSPAEVSTKMQHMHSALQAMGCACAATHHAHKAEHEGLLPLKHSCAEWRQCYDALGPDSAPALVLDESCM